MNGAMAKATRREIRRAFGAQAAQEVETIATDVRVEVRETKRALEVMLRQGSADRARITELETRLNRMYVAQLTWWPRLKWLFRGYR